jgi:hypothetical protein
MVGVVVGEMVGLGATVVPGVVITASLGLGPQDIVPLIPQVE